MPVAAFDGSERRPRDWALRKPTSIGAGAATLSGAGVISGQHSIR
jgi:hypothetical protein